jgi:hypothetical protein
LALADAAGFAGAELAAAALLAAGFTGAELAAGLAAGAAPSPHAASKLAPHTSAPSALIRTFLTDTND